MEAKKVVVNGVELVLKDNIGGWCRYYLIEGKLTNKEIVEKVRARFGGKTTVACVAWYKGDLVDKGIFTKGARGAQALSLEDFAAADK